MEKKSVHTELINKIRTAESILLTVGQNPSIDDLVAISGLSLGLKQANKQVQTLFSGQIPDKIRFLDPTFDENTNNLRDFIVSLDSAKAKKISIKKESDISKIVITPKNELTQDDLKYELGELKVDLVLVIGATTPNDLDTSLIDSGVDSAKVIFINTTYSSSYSETIAELLIEITNVKIDTSIANFLLTGIIVATDQFGNEKATSKTFQIAAKLLKLGADQQLIVENLKYAPDTSIQTDEIKPTNQMSGVSYEDLLREEVENIPETPQPQKTPTQPDIGFDIDLTIPPMPVPAKKITKVGTANKNPNPGLGNEDLPPPPPAPSFQGLDMPPSIDFAGEIAPPPIANSGESSESAQNNGLLQPSDPNQFHIPV